MHPGTYSITGHGGDPCTFYETTVLAGEYDVCCGECWGSGLFLSAPAVLKSIDLKGGKLKLAQFTAGKATSQQLIANEAGVYDVGFEYETRMTHVNGVWGFIVPTRPATTCR